MRGEDCSVQGQMAKLQSDLRSQEPAGSYIQIRSTCASDQFGSDDCNLKDRLLVRILKSLAGLVVRHKLRFLGVEAVGYNSKEHTAGIMGW